MFYTTNNRMVNDFFDDLNIIFDDSESIRRMNRNKSNHKIESDDNGITLTIDVPGYNKKLIEISVDGDSLIIEGKSNSGNPDGFNHKFTMNDSFDVQEIEASVVDGVLTLLLPYLEKVKPKKVKVKVT